MSTPGSGRDASRKDDVTGLLNAHRTGALGGLYDLARPQVGAHPDRFGRAFCPFICL